MNKAVIYKNLGETPLEALERFRAEVVANGQFGPNFADAPMTYAGRLDPMAEGLLLILIGDECKKKEQYLGLDKEYEVEILFGVSTDTYDTLGLIEKIENTPPALDLIEIQKYTGKFVQEYPRYSSRIISMKELPDEMPTKEVEIFSIEKIDQYELLGKKIADVVLENIAKVKGDFRQTEISKRWLDFAKENSATKFTILKLKVACSSGTYMRSLAHRMGNNIGIPTLAFSIKRTQIKNLK